MLYCEYNFVFTRSSWWNFCILCCHVSLWSLVGWPKAKGSQGRVHTKNDSEDSDLRGITVAPPSGPTTCREGHWSWACCKSAGNQVQGPLEVQTCCRDVEHNELVQEVERYRLDIVGLTSAIALALQARLLVMDWTFLELFQVRSAGQMWGYSQAPECLTRCWDSIQWKRRLNFHANFSLLRGRLFLLHIRKMCPTRFSRWCSFVGLLVRWMSVRTGKSVKKSVKWLGRGSAPWNLRSWFSARKWVGCSL